MRHGKLRLLCFPGTASTTAPGAVEVRIGLGAPLTGNVACVRAKGDVTGYDTFVWYRWEDGEYAPVDLDELTD